MINYIKLVLNLEMILYYVIHENSKYTLDEIVERMCQIKYLYEYCNYNKYKNDAYKQYLEDKKYGHVDYRVSDLAEMNALIMHILTEFILIYFHGIIINLFY